MKDDRRIGDGGSMERWKDVYRGNGEMKATWVRLDAPTEKIKGGQMFTNG